MELLAPRDLERLFHDPAMFDSASSWHKAGFKIVRDSDNYILVAKHKAAKDVLFKKYSNQVSLQEQHARYVRRLEGARKLQALIETKHLRRIVVPRKQIVELPRQFTREMPSYILVVEKLRILDRKESEYAYRHVDDKVLGELCSVFFACRDLDFTARNAPFTKEDKIAFIDTERIDYWRDQDIEERRVWYLHCTCKYWTEQRMRRAEDLWNVFAAMPA